MHRNLLILGPKLIPTDEMILEGTCFLLKQAGILHYKYQSWSETQGVDIVSDTPPTHILIMGTPWLWDQCWLSPKYNNLIKFLEQYPNTTVLFCGIGSCLPLGKEAEVAQDLKNNLNHLKKLFKNHTVVVRDTLAHSIIPNSILMPCPAFYALYDMPTTPLTLDTIIWYDPTIGLSHVDYGPGSGLLNNYISAFRSKHEQQPQSKVFCVSETEKKLAQEIGLPEPELISDITHAKRILNESKSIFSGRVHLSVPAYTRTPDITLIPVDSREKVLSDVQAGLIRTPKEALQNYTSIISNFWKS